MTIFTLEGPSGVGKTTTAEALCDATDAYRVPEVNELFDTAESDTETWYFERQCERWQRAVDRDHDHDLVVLDGDVFQPLWYNWFRTHVPDAEGRTDPFATLDTVAAFYRERLAERAVGFPDQYVVLQSEEETLRTRKRADQTRRRRNFEYHLHLVEPQRTYFERLEERSPGRVRLLDARAVEETVSAIHSAAQPPTTSTRRYDGTLFETMVEWLRGTKPPR